MKMINRYCCLFGIMVVAFVTTILPLNADNEFYMIPEENITAYKYWFTMGGSTFSEYENNDDSIYIPVHSETTTTNYNGYYCYSTSSNANFANYCRYYNSSNSSQVSPKETTTNSAYYENVNVGATKFNMIDGTISGVTNPTSYSFGKSLYIYANTPIYIYFWSSSFFPDYTPTLYVNNNANVSIEYIPGGPRAAYFWRLGYVINSDIACRIVINWGANLTSSTKIRPVFIGSLEEMSDSMRDKLGYDTKTMELLRSGDNITQDNVNSNNEVTSDLDNQNSDLHALENTFNDNMNNAFDDIDLTNNITSNNKFISSAIWVRRRFDELIIGTPFEYILVFSLILGIGLTIVGKLRG